MSPVSEAKSMAGRLPEQNSKIAAEATVAADLLQPALQDLQQLHLVLQAPPPGRAAENPPAEPATQRQGADESSQARAELVLRMRRSGAPSCGLRPFAGPDAAATKSLQSCPTLCDPTDGSPPGSSVHGVSQARVLEWGTIALSEKMSLVVVLPELSFQGCQLEDRTSGKITYTRVSQVNSFLLWGPQFPHLK